MQVPSTFFRILLLLSVVSSFVPSSAPNRIRYGLHYSTTQQDDTSLTSANTGEMVSVRIDRQVDNCALSPSDALETWLEQHWKKGGGLPIIVLTGGSNHDGNNMRKRTILPVAMEETCEYQKADADEHSATITYTVSNAGPFFADLVPNSHVGTVQFSRRSTNSTSLSMVWQVEFETTRFQALYQAVTEFTIGIASRTVAEALAPSRVMKVQAELPVPPVNDELPNRYALRQWLEFFWARGGGLPLPPPIPFGPVLDQGSGTARASILRIPPALVDTVLSVEDTNDYMVEAVYQIENPGWTTVPFLIHTHLGRARFLSANKRDTNAVDIIWEIQVRPFPLMAPLVEKLLEMTATTIVRNLIVHMKDPGARVVLQPPRGKAIEIGDGIKVERFGSIPKASWLGGVLDVHLKDQRSSLEQTMSLLQPWTWGYANAAGSDRDTVGVSWKTGDMDP